MAKLRRVNTRALAPHSSPLLLLGTLLVAFTAAWMLRLRAEELRPETSEAAFDVPPFPVEVARPFSFGLSAFAADLTFLEAVQVHGARKSSNPPAEQEAQDRALARLLDYTVEMDPLFGGAYRFAGSALPRHTLDGKAKNVLAAEQILRKGVRERPDDWRIAFQLGFVESFYLAKMGDAARAMAQAAALPGAPRYIGFLATRLAADAGALDMGEQLAAAMEATATEEATREAWHQRLLDLRMERDLRALEAAAARFKARTGHESPSLAALVQAGDLAGLPEEPHGGQYTLLPDGEARSSAAPRLRVRGRAGTQSGLLAQ